VHCGAPGSAEGAAGLLCGSTFAGGYVCVCLCVCVCVCVHHMSLLQFPPVSVHPSMLQHHIRNTISQYLRMIGAEYN